MTEHACLRNIEKLLAPRVPSPGRAAAHIAARLSFLVCTRLPEELRFQVFPFLCFDEQEPFAALNHDEIHQALAGPADSTVGAPQLRDVIEWSLAVEVSPGLIRLLDPHEDSREEGEIDEEARLSEACMSNRLSEKIMRGFLEGLVEDLPEELSQAVYRQLPGELRRRFVIRETRRAA